MFGDIAHGAIILFFGLYLMKQEFVKIKTTNAYSRVQKQYFKVTTKKTVVKGLFKEHGQMLTMLHPYRYLITLMGFFAVYAGFM
jgi:vacuolar-type H+-ATPase subunit I/STV1